jgi:iron complex transport system substrate-binding protein
MLILAVCGPAVSRVSFASGFEDALGRRVTLRGTPERIVPLAPSLTEILYAIGAGDFVVGVTEFSSYPPEALLKPKVGSYVKLNIERIIALNPDLVIGTVDGNQPWIVATLEEAGIPVYVVNPRKVSGLLDTIRAIGRICGRSLEAEKVAAGIERRIDRTVSKVASLRRPVVFLQIQVAPIMTVNRNTFHHDLIHLAGGENMAGGEVVTYPRISREEVVKRGPEVIIISSMERGGRFEEARQNWLEWTAIPAVRSNRVHLIDSDLLDRPSPRMVEGLEALARIIHPEVCWE